jgi:hypothetical protein
VLLLLGVVALVAVHGATSQNSLSDQRTALDRVAAATQDIRFYNGDVSGWQSVEARKATLVRESRSTGHSSVTITIIVAILAALVGVAAALLLTRTIVKPVSAVVDRLRSLGPRQARSRR